MHTRKSRAAAATSDYLSVEVRNPQLCHAIPQKVVKNVKIGPSPRWMRASARQWCSSIDNIVDITNYVMPEYGQPMHAF